ncbi:hypothetical protein J0X19_19830 [Hymenobacter sp. BT186]|uniref:DUF5689 domain-containing protein n=1 Tax=Hymenobacter telluris TaxID=2816474 RepID=A0A939JFA6_9BACT|nr:DUF5689 domain-containing protein [Hymenobacter telluris]MBO0360222.1 hypothetical protein [Hymenobacter telluris]MBW3376249.1 hypothetical protein [Hymenobacter norwichensis]
MLGVLGLTSCLEDNPDYAVGTPSPITSIEDVRRLYQGENVPLQAEALAGAHQIVGLVVSDATGLNVPGGANTIVVQNKRRGAVRGMIIPLSGGGPTFAVGDSVVVDIAGGTLAKTNGSLRIEGLTPGHVTKISSNNPIRTQDINVEALKNNLDAYEGTLVRITGSSITPVPVSGDTYSGNKTLADGSGNRLTLHTEATAAFAGRRIPASATFIGIAVGGLDASQEVVSQLWLRTAADAVDPSGPIYLNFPESFESVPQATKGSYDMNTAAVPDNTVRFTSGPWKLYQSILGNTSGRDRYTGTQGIRMQQNLTVPAVVEMKFDLPNGATKVTLIYGAYYTDAASSWKLEYSQDQGATWQQTGPTITDAGNWQRSITFLMNISGPVRFRINKLGLGVSSPPTILNGRLGLDDIAIYEN